ncbi:MAG TPA: Rne/Rng family ribonuclease [Gaiellaceae bacterium]
MPLNWFRRKDAAEELAPAQPEAAAPVEAPEVPAVAEPAEGPEADGQSAAGPRKRRRGNRGGRGRKKTSSTSAAQKAESAEKAEKAEKPEKSEKPQRKPRERTRPQTRTRTAPRRAPLPKAKRELLISVDPGEKRVAVLEDDRVAEVYLERPEQRSIAGNVYLGTVDNVLPGMEAAFVEIGLEKNGFLYVDEIVGPELEGRRGARKIQDLIQRGQTVLVQAVKDPMKTKGARLTTEISLPGRFVVFVPHGDGLGVSRRLEDDERNRLKAILKEIAPKHGGIIVRTAAEGASADDIGRDLEFLQRLWKTIEAQAKTATAPSLIYQEAELPLRVTRDLFTESFEKLYVDHDRTHKRIVGYLKKTSPHMVDRVVRYKEKDPLLEAFGAEQEIKSTLNRRVDLPSGGYLIFDYAEAFTVIDVNTGRFVGSRAKKGGPGRLEDTITKNNLEAVKEVVRQLRLRDVGGIIVIDFIDMANPRNRAQVEEALRTELERDRTKTYVVEISPLGLVEMTRQNVTDGPREVMTRKCPTCNGDGIIVSEGTTAVEIERQLRGLVTPGSRAKAFRVELSARVAAIVAGPGGSRLRELEELTKRNFFLVGLADVHLDHFRVLDRGDAERLAPEAPVAVGEELELKLVEVGLYDPQAGVGKVKEFNVVVADAAKLVGKKIKVRIGAVTENAAYAEQIDLAVEEGPITAEAEAERPTRAPRKVAAPKKAEKPEPVPADTEASDVQEEDTEAAAPGAPAKKKTRRGTRGGRNRKKKTAVVAPPATTVGVESENGSEPADEEATAAPVIHVPERDLGAEPSANGDEPAAAPVRKKTRRGSRGGRNRKKKTAVVAAGGVATVEAPEVPEPEPQPGPEPEPEPQSEPEPQPEAESQPDADWKYTPMSEWGDD